jgi:hypothetical protein
MVMGLALTIVSPARADASASKEVIFITSWLLRLLAGWKRHRLAQSLDEKARWRGYVPGRRCENWGRDETNARRGFVTRSGRGARGVGKRLLNEEPKAPANDLCLTLQAIRLHILALYVSILVQTTYGFADLFSANFLSGCSLSGIIVISSVWLASG